MKSKGRPRPRRNAIEHEAYMRKEKLKLEASAKVQAKLDAFESLYKAIEHED